MFEIVCFRNNDVFETGYVSDDVAVDVFIRKCRKYIGEARVFKEDTAFRGGHYFISLSDQSGTPKSVMVMMLGQTTAQVFQRVTDRIEDVFSNKCEYCGTRISIGQSKCSYC